MTPKKLLAEAIALATHSPFLKKSPHMSPAAGPGRTWNGFQNQDPMQQQRLRMIDDMPVAVMTVDLATFKINYANETSKRTLRAIEYLLPVKADDIVGTSIDVFHPHPEHQRKLIGNPANLPHHARIRLGPEVLDLQITAVHDANGGYIGPMLTWSIVTRQVRAEEDIRRLAHQDMLTGLPNRPTFLEKLEQNLASPHGAIGLLYIDLDGFKSINDGNGHRAGDEVLRQVASRLLTEHRRTPGMTLGRIGGDEFAALLPDTCEEKATSIAARLVEALSAPYIIESNRQVRIGASIGYVLTRRRDEGAETMLARADMALYAAKAAGKRTFRMFVAEMEVREQERARLEAELQVALQNPQDLFVFYQPIVNIRTRKVTAKEALVRWHSPRRGWVPPEEFIPIAESSGLIDRLGQFVLNRACREAAHWKDGVCVAVNVSAAQLGRGIMEPIIAAALAESGLPAGRLEIEVTETALLRNESVIVAELRAIRDMGVRVALDDFGTGFSSLAHIRTLRFDKIKIDGSFVRDAVLRPDCAAVVKAIAYLGQRLGVTTVAEGVETLEQLGCVREEGCLEVQGYLFGRPVPSEADAQQIEEIAVAQYAGHGATA